MVKQAAGIAARAMLPTLIMFTASCALAATSDARGRDRDGKEVVEAVCGVCHASGKDGAPRIGDAAAWSARASKGLTALGANAIQGIRKMPAHGGDFGVSDVEVQRAIAYMVNNSGGHWIEPARAATRGRSSEALVQAQCARCHESGAEGAPKIGDRTAWTPRLARGLDALVASASHGHGPMPARGGMPELEGDEIRGAILYMFNYGLPPVTPPPPAAAADPRHKVLAGMDVYFGAVPAETLRAAQRDAKGAPTKAGIPSGRDYYHLNISLADQKSGAQVQDAKVTLRVSDGMTLQTETLAPVSAKNAVSYGSFFKLSRGGAYNIQAEVSRPGLPRPAVTNFEFRAP